MKDMQNDDFFWCAIATTAATTEKQLVVGCNEPRECLIWGLDEQRCVFYLFFSLMHIWNWFPTISKSNVQHWPSSFHLTGTSQCPWKRHSHTLKSLAGGLPFPGEWMGMKVISMSRVLHIIRLDQHTPGMLGPYGLQLGWASIWNVGPFNNWVGLQC